MRRIALLKMPLLILALAFGHLAVTADPVPSVQDGPTTIVLVRHAEKQAGDNPALSADGVRRAAALAHALEDLSPVALYASQFRRTQQTLSPVAEKLGLEVTVSPLDRNDLAGSLASLARRILKEHPGQVVVVAGHSNTVPSMIEALGVGEAPALSEADYDDLFVVISGEDRPAALLHLHYGAASP